MKKTSNNGFTIVELMIASMVFSVILLLVTTGVLQIGKSYYKGVLQSRTQETARNIIDEISRGIQFSGETIIPTTKVGIPVYPGIRGSNYTFCVNGTGYSYVMDRQLDASITSTYKQKYVLISYPVSCGSFTLKTPTGAQSISGSKELVGLGMKITQLEVKDNLDGTYSITVEVASGERDLFKPFPISSTISTLCKGGAGSQFCAMSKLTTTVQKRVK